MNLGKYFSFVLPGAARSSRAPPGHWCHSRPSALLRMSSLLFILRFCSKEDSVLTFSSKITGLKLLLVPWYLVWCLPVADGFPQCFIIVLPPAGIPRNNPRRALDLWPAASAPILSLKAQSLHLSQFRVPLENILSLWDKRNAKLFSLLSNQRIYIAICQMFNNFVAVWKTHTHTNIERKNISSLNNSTCERVAASQTLASK